ncbi:Protein disulfide-isomerase [Apiospora aurea]|uniref:Protein disulfide-isomerase n=1 Tax=Apiospora aurea TaxID=335848 RepID=A0ABR1Q5D1_9PEZI
MKLLVSLCALSVASATIGRRHGWSHISEKDFKLGRGEAISQGQNMLVAFIEPTTAACDALEPVWARVEEASNWAISIDCVRNQQLCKDYNVISYPAIRLLDSNGKMTPYRGPRTSNAILFYLKRASRRAVSKLEDEKAVTAFQSVDDVVVMAQLHPTRDAHLQTLFAAVADRYWDRASFGSIASISPAAIVCYSNRDRAGDPPSVLSDMTAVDAIPKFVEKCMAPLIGELTRKTEGKLLQSGKSLVYYFSPDSLEREEYAASMRAVARKYEEYLLFVTVDAEEYADMVSMLGLRPEALPAVAVQNPMYGQVFPYDQKKELSAQAIEQFVTQIASGKVKPWDGTPPPPVAAGSTASSSPKESEAEGKHKENGGSAHDEL